MFGFGKKKEVVEYCDTDHLYHDEDILDKTVLPSAYEQMDQNTRKRVFEDEFVDSEHFRQKLIFTLKCKRCGRVRQLIEINP
jgi:formylmethanofuran dehydrogenase subunit E